MAENGGIEKVLFDKIIKLNKECNYHNLLKMYITKICPGEAIMEMIIDHEHINPQNVAHGGAAYSLADTVMGIAIRSLNHLGVTIEMNINYTRPAMFMDKLTAQGKVLNLGKRIIVTQGKVYNQKNELLAISRGTFYNTGAFLKDDAQPARCE